VPPVRRPSRSAAGRAWTDRPSSPHSSSHLLEATVEGGTAWCICGDDIKRALLADARQRERLAIDFKAEGRGGRARHGRLDRLRRTAERQRHRIATGANPFRFL
jgi:hypothetical protein